MKKCSNCGHENIDDAIFCAECGFKLDSISSSQDSSKSSSDSDDSNPEFKIFSFENLRNNIKSNGLCWCCLMPFIILGLLLWASDVDDFIKGLNPEDYETSYLDEFNALDLNSDGKLEFNEVNNIVSHTPQEELYEYFQKSDKNGNGYLFGYEFDIFERKAIGNSYEREYKRLEEERERNASKKKGGRDYSSGTNRYTNGLNNQEFDRKGGYVLTCPYCGSESIYETNGHYKCAECGSNIYNPDDLELGYWEGYMELLVPISSLMT